MTEGFQFEITRIGMQPLSFLVCESDDNGAAERLSNYTKTNNSSDPTVITDLGS